MQVERPLRRSMLRDKRSSAGVQSPSDLPNIGGLSSQLSKSLKWSLGQKWVLDALLAVCGVGRCSVLEMRGLLDQLALRDWTLAVLLTVLLSSLESTLSREPQLPLPRIWPETTYLRIDLSRANKFSSAQYTHVRMRSSLFGVLLTCIPSIIGSPVLDDMKGQTLAAPLIPITLTVSSGASYRRR